MSKLIIPIRNRDIVESEYEIVLLRLVAHN